MIALMRRIFGSSAPGRDGGARRGRGRPVYVARPVAEIDMSALRARVMNRLSKTRAYLAKR